MQSTAARMMIRVALVVACLIVAGGSLLHAATPAQQVPREWGMPTLAPSLKMQTSPESAQPISPNGLLLAPRATLIIGVGTVDPADYLRQQTAQASTYTVRAAADSIVEYLFPAVGFFPPGSPLVRLYDTGILPDLAKAEQAAKRYLDQPFTILNPSPSGAYPSPTSTSGRAQRIHIAQPAPRQSTPTEPMVTSSSAAPAKLVGIARHANAGGFRVEAEDTARPGEVEGPQENVAELQAQLAAMQDDLGRLADEQAGLLSAIGRAEAALRAANEDLEAREALCKQGVMARNAVEPYREKHKKLAVELAGLRERESELSSAMASLKSQVADLKSRIEDTRTAAAQARKRQAARTNPEAAPKKLPGLPVTNPAPIQQPASPGSAASTVPRSAQPAFPSPLGNRGERIDPGVEALAEHIDELAAAERRSRPSLDLPPVPQALMRLGEPRWQTLSAPTSGMVVDRIAPDGAHVTAGAELLRVANTQWATVYADLLPEYLGQYRHGSPVMIRFDDYPGTEFEGWINNLMPSPDGEHIRAEVCVLCRSGYFGTDAYATLQWLTQTATLDQDSVDTCLAPATQTLPDPNAGPISACSMLPLAPVSLSVGKLTVEKEVPGAFVGHVQVAELSPATAAVTAGGETEKKRLEKLAKWRKSFTEGMTSTIFADRLVLAYPAQGEARAAIERMASGRVTHVTNRCARTMAEALGWGLGDAADWADGLPSRGYRLREDGLCRPGDILVWRFTYGSRMNQHIGFAVLQGGRMMLLSNSAGRLGTSEILPGYLAFYKPDEKATATD